MRDICYAVRQYGPMCVMHKLRMLLKLCDDHRPASPTRFTATLGTLDSATSCSTAGLVTLTRWWVTGGAL